MFVTPLTQQPPLSKGCLGQLGSIHMPLLHDLILNLRRLNVPYGRSVAPREDTHSCKPAARLIPQMTPVVACQHGGAGRMRAADAPVMTGCNKRTGKRTFTIQPTAS